MRRFGSRSGWVLLLLSLVTSPSPARAAGVTLITHGLNGNVDGWVTGMADRIPNYSRFPGTNFSNYTLSFVPNGSGYLLTAARVSVSPPASTESGEIILKLDWSQLADGNSYDTYQVTAAVLPALLSTNFLPEFSGHAIAELPLHLIGHSRGGSLICELSKQLGTNGIWVDHLSTLDPHPLNNDGFDLDIFLYSAVDAPARTYSNVLFHDNYWQNIDTFIYGEPVAGAYVRRLTNLTGGSGGLGGAHSDVHLWYHGTLDWLVPATDTETTLGASERNTWWAATEGQGTNAGFNYSLIGGSDRLSVAQPLGSGTAAIRDGFNQMWDLGAGQSANRTALPDNSGNWPNLVRINRVSTNQVVQGQSTPLKVYYQWAQPVTSSAKVSFYLDDDLNPLNGNETFLGQLNVPGTEASAVSNLVVNVELSAANASPGRHSLFAKINAGGQQRYLYAPELVEVLSSQQPPTMDIAQISPSQIRIGMTGLPGQTLILQASPNLQTWQSIATNTLSAGTWTYTNAVSPSNGREFYRAVFAN